MRLSPHPAQAAIKCREASGIIPCIFLIQLYCLYDMDYY
ncbi:Uncharacterized protein dnl_22390 [Desulfonema limicola]|uniref:Uncharacterized protein n=1 Tax=Desulfonema limicola TaxID=45656 RepID=A0A975B7F2_9BACT|nr:Uncharacterized protein dnl_22390 [Desulfonema limicola]